VHERYERASSLFVKKTSANTLLAGIRADGATFIAFPSACSKRSVASDESGMHFYNHWLESAFVRLPLRGQRRLEVEALSDEG
jgi:hypothetical protein